jgi:DNA repair protein RadC
MIFFTVSDAPSPYRVDRRQQNTALIRAITGASLSKAQKLAEFLQIRDFTEIPASQVEQIGFKDNEIKRLKAAYDFGKYQFLGVSKCDITQELDSPEIAAKPIQEKIGASRIEQGCLLVLDVKHHILHCGVIAIGSETECIITPRVIFETVLRYGGCRFILAHNHPSGDLEPSDQDLKLTQQILQASEVMDLVCLDHLIVHCNRFNSLRQYTDLWN